MISRIAPLLKPGDLLLYQAGRDPISWAIQTRTGSAITHVENYMANGRTVGSRIPAGVRMYTLAEEVGGMPLAQILRPASFDLKPALDWFVTEADGQGYDFLGVISFGLAKAWAADDRMFCSAFTLRLLRAGGCDVLPGRDPHGVAPGDFVLDPPRLTEVWRA
jgi:hypothetical protein